MTQVDVAHAVVMGGSSGVGLATARTLAEAGMRVTITGRDAARLERARDAIATVAPAAEVAAHAVDGADAALVRSFFAGLGGFDHLVLALSGGAGGGPFATLELADLRTGFEAKFWVHVLAAQAALPSIRPGGSITFVTAASARMANPGTAGLAAINGALQAMVPPLARELAPVRVNAVSPGVIDTPWWDRVPDDMRTRIFAAASRVPAGRVGRAEDVAHAVRFVVENGFVTGITVDCDGGIRLGGMAE